MHVSDSNPVQTLAIHSDVRALEEWKQLQSIIGRCDGLEFQIRGWLLVLLGALIASLFSSTSKLKPSVFFIVGVMAILMFAFMELTFRMTKRRAIRRSREVEEALREGYGYDGPAITVALSHASSISIKVYLNELRILSVWVFYVALLLVVGLIRLNS